jgi:aminoglycoside phosphotransferase (APT) family kinase protein
MDAGAAARLVAELAPDLATQPLEALPGGWDHVVLASRELVFRFPRRGGEALEREAVLLGELCRTLPVPRPVRLVRSAAGELVFVASTRIAGARLVDVQVSARQRRLLATDLAALLRRLAELAGPARAWGLPELGGADIVAELHELRQEARSALAEELTDSVRARLDQSFSRLLAELEPPKVLTLVHGDLNADNILITAEGRLAGVLDWTEAHVGDRALDLGTLTFGCGTPLADDLLELLEADAALRQRVAWAAWLIVPCLEALDALSLSDEPRRHAIARLAKALLKVPGQ